MRLPRRVAPRKVVFWGLCAVLVFVPLPIGLTENWAIFVFEASTVLLFFLYILSKRSSSKVEKDNSQVSRIPILFKILLAVFIGMSFLQLIPLPQGVLKILSPQTHNIYGGIFSGGMNGNIALAVVVLPDAVSPQTKILRPYCRQSHRYAAIPASSVPQLIS